jgi:hypothetical protein
MSDDTSMINNEKNIHEIILEYKKCSEKINRIDDDLFKIQITFSKIEKNFNDIITDSKNTNLHLKFIGFVLIIMFIIIIIVSSNITYNNVYTNNTINT